MNEARIGDLKKIDMRIREVRLEKKMSQTDLAEKAQISLPQISDIENGKSNMMLTTFISITEALQAPKNILCKSPSNQTLACHAGTAVDFLMSGLLPEDRRGMRALA